MKSAKWIWGPLALTVGLIPPTTLAASAQNNATTTPTKSPAPPSGQAGASSIPSLPTLLVWDASATSASRVGPWGNGSAEVTRGRTGTTLLVKTLNLDEGVRFDPAKPLDISSYRQTGFWRIRAQINAAPRGGRGGRNRTPANTAAQGTAPLTQLRLKLVLDQGVMSGFVSIGQPGRRSRGGQSQNLLIPMRRLSSSPGARGLVRRIILTGDSTASFNLEQLSLVAETDRITATVRRSTDAPGSEVKTITVKPGRSTTLVADVNGGTSDLNVSWNFNADNSVAFPPPGAGQGATGRGGRGRGQVAGAPVTGGRPSAGTRGSVGGTAGGNTGVVRRRVDATGLSARPNWPNEEQDYRVEVTVTDRAGKKPAVKKSILVQVRGGN